MERLRALDGVTLHAETDVMRTHAGGLILIESQRRGRELTSEDVIELLATRLPTSPAFRKRLVAKPFGLGQPLWVDDRDFDVRSHLHRRTLRAPGTADVLAELVADLHGQRQDRNRPLWDAWVIDGLDDGRIALLLQLSHAMTDGVGGVTSILPQLMTTDPNAELPPADHEPLDRTPHSIEVLGDMAVELVGNGVTTARVALKVAPALISGAVRSATAPMRRILVSDGNRPRAQAPAANPRPDNSPRTILNSPITARRSVAFVTLSMADLRSAATAHGGTINDVFLTAATNSVRRWLEIYDTVPTASLRTLMPISTRTHGDGANNSWGMGVVKLPVHLSDPAEQLSTIHADTQRLKSDRSSSPPVDLNEVLKVIPPVVIGSLVNVYTAQRLSRLHAPVAHVVTSNIPGPAEQVYLAGARVTGMFATPPLFEGANINITAASHGSVLDVSIIACPDNIEDVQTVARGLAETVQELLG